MNTRLINLCALSVSAFTLLLSGCASTDSTARPISERAITVAEIPPQNPGRVGGPVGLSNYDRDVLRLNKGMLRYIGQSEHELGGEPVATGIEAATASYNREGAGVLRSGPLRMLQWGEDIGEHPSTYDFNADAGQRWWIGRKSYIHGLNTSYSGPPTTADYDRARRLAIWQLGVDPKGFAPPRWVPVVPQEQIPAAVQPKSQKPPGARVHAPSKRQAAREIRMIPATVTRVIDGDTFVCDLDLGVGVVLNGQRIRVDEIDTIERRDPGGPAATAAATGLLLGKRVTLRMPHPPIRTLERIVAGVTLPDGRDFAAAMQGFRKAGGRSGSAGSLADERRMRAAPPTWSGLPKGDWIDRLFPGSTFDSRTWTALDWMRHDHDRAMRRMFTTVRVTGRHPEEAW